MFIKELLVKFSIDEIYNRLIELRPYILEFVIENEIKLFKKACFIAYDNILKAEYVINNENILICSKQLSFSKEDDFEYEVSLLNIKDCKEGFYFFDGENCIQRYSLFFTPWKEFLGFEICQLSIDLYGELDVCCCIFYELMHTGIDNETRNDFIKRETEILVERAENFKEEDCIPAEEVFKSLRDDLIEELEKEGKFEEADEIRNWEEEEETEEERAYIKQVIYENQNILFKFKKYISENY